MKLDRRIPHRQLSGGDAAQQKMTERGSPGVRGYYVINVGISIINPELFTCFFYTVEYWSLLREPDRLPSSVLYHPFVMYKTILFSAVCCFWQSEWLYCFLVTVINLEDYFFPLFSSPVQAWNRSDSDWLLVGWPHMRKWHQTFLGVNGTSLQPDMWAPVSHTCSSFHNL